MSSSSPLLLLTLHAICIEKETATENLYMHCKSSYPAVFAAQSGFIAVDFISFRFISPRETEIKDEEEKMT